jgi:hypothetical protein
MQPRRRLKRQGCVTLIDLGEIGAFEEPPDPSPPPRPRWLNRLGVPDRRRAAAVGALAILAGGLAGTAPRTMPEATLHIVADVTAESSIAVVDDLLVNASPDGLLAAYDLPTGTKLWSTEIGEHTYLLAGVEGAVLYQLGPTPGIEVATPSTANFWRAMARGSLNSVDARTGRLRWHHPGTSLGPTGSDVVVMLMPSDALPNGEIGGWRLVGVDPRDGHDRWSQPMPDHTQWTFRYGTARPDVLDPSTVMLVAPDGGMSTVDTHTGRRTPIGRIPADAFVEWSWLDLVAVRRPDPARPIDPDRPPPGADSVPTRFEVYRLTDLASPLWGRPLTDADDVPQPCGDTIVCFWHSTGLDRLDPRTGAPATRDDDYTEFLTPGALGLWETNGANAANGATEAVAFVAPAAARTKEGWLGLVRFRRPRPQILPLVRIPFAVDGCWNATPRWLVCSGGTGTIAVRQSEFGAMVPATGGKPS